MIRKFWLLTLLVMAIAACGGAKPGDDGAHSSPVKLTMMSHDSFAISEDTLASFEKAENAEVILLPAGDAGAALNQAILAKEDPLADIFFGVDNTFLGRALEAEIFEPYESPVLEMVPESLHLDPTYTLLPVDFGDVCLNYDIAWFESAGISPPKSLADLIHPDYFELLVVENPATSSPGLAFLLTTIGVYGVDSEYNYLDFWQDLKENGVLITQGWEDAYYGHFSVSGDGDRPLVVSYASSPPAEVIFAEAPIDEPPTATVTAPDTCFRQVEFVGILQGSGNRALAEKFVDFMLEKQFQEDIPLNMFVFPANEQAALPEVFVRWAEIPDEPVVVDSATIAANRDTWIKTWTERILR
jgi:thiamine transport system substrate-binding protein